MRTPGSNRTAPDHNRQRADRERVQGFTLVEIAVASMVVTMLVIGILASLIQSRKMTETAIYQNSAVTVVQGYIEQMKNMDFTELPYYDGSTLKRGSATTADAVIYTQLDSTVYDTLTLSSGTAPSKTTLDSGTRPTGAVDNSKIIDINNTPDDTNDDLRMNIWVWITPLTDSSHRIGESRLITLVYTWGFQARGLDLSYVDSLATVRSKVPTF